ncbi:PAS domain-containing hybrid sensor histidine kinase/response regulator [Rhodoferax antarcticus]|uniref:PAS domain-containing hybrid sensor histidine kinase/response regulator n=1 Tax=Rhodoferax antarcticus TaxID=81479 RepID=UPI0029FF0BBF|nr:ATP-binding protein [Rhodoferax antarcticus]MCW2311637.1 PAS domain S-box-containing protein [Rhodoferax antarcticus]
MKNILKPLAWVAATLLLLSSAGAYFTFASVYPRLEAMVLLALSLAGFLVFWGAQKTKQAEISLAHLDARRLLAAQEDSNYQLLQANEKARDSAQKLAVTLDSIGDAVIAADAQARVTLINPVAQKLTGWTQEQALGQPVDEVFRIVGKTSRERLTVPVLAALEQGTVQGLANHTLLLARDGAEYDVADSCAPMRDAQGLVVGAVLVFRNVTEDYAAQQALRQVSALQNAIFNSANFSSIATDAKGVIQIFNVGAERMLGYTASEVVNQVTPADLTDPQELVVRAAWLSKAFGTSISPGFEALVFKAARGMEDIDELNYICKDGRRLPALVSVTALRDEAEAIIGYLLIGTDNTARRAAEVEREQLDHALRAKNAELEAARSAADKANLAKSEFLSAMSHELRSPLNAILGFAQLMESGAPLPTASQKASIEQILRAGWYLLELINEVLDLALIESGQLSLSREPVSLSEVLHDCQTLMMPMALKKEVSLHFAALPEPCFVDADRTRLKQVVINLLSNAIKYNRVGGSVTVICIERKPGWVRLSVQDTGDGLSADKVAQLFQPFNRLGKESSDEEGTGIGLIVSKRLVEQMGGEMGVISAEGAGSVFWVELAHIGAPQLTDEISDMLLSQATPLPAGERKRTLLYVEDNRANMELMAQLIARRPDMRLFGAEDAIRGIAMAREHQPDVILLDINLPGISGLQALQILQEDEATRHIPVLALSANAMPRDIERGLAAGFFRYLTKPIRVTEFMEALDAGLALAQTQQVTL